MRKKHNKQSLVRITFSVPEKLYEEIQAYKKEYYFSNMTEALKVLVAKGIYKERNYINNNTEEREKSAENYLTEVEE